MKRLFTFGLTVLLAVVTVAAQGYRKWDFTNWSAETIANLQADAAASSTEGWSDIEKAANAGEGKVASDETRNKCFWLTDANGGELTANGVAIRELEGLDFNSGYSSKRSLAIAVDYPSTSLGEYAGPQYLWLGGGKNKVPCFTIHNVRIGQKITMTVESHKQKPAEARGVELYVGAVDDANKIGDSFKPTTQETYTWEEGWALPEAAVSEDGETVDVIVYNTNGCHIYSIEIGDNTEQSKVAYLYGGTLDEELALKQISSSEKFIVETVEANAAFTLEQLTAYDAIVISSTVSNAEAIASLKEIFPFVPTLNLNPALYQTWGLGEVADAGTQFALALNANHALFRGLDLIENPDNDNAKEVLMLTNEGDYKALTLAGRFADDVVLATAMGSEAVAIHGHNLSHNGYLYIPYTQENLAAAATPAILSNAVSVLTNSKSKVGQAPKPTFSMEYKNQNTIVTINSSVAGSQVYYTTDGSTPTEQSELYTEPLSLMQACILKAVAIGDGYLMSDVAELQVILKSQAEQPVIALEQEDGKTLVTLSCNRADASIYYNFTGSTNTAESSLYEEPFAIDILNRVLYAFAIADGFVNSELSVAEVPIRNPKVRIDVLAHMDASAETYNEGNTSTSYYFSWGKDKNAYSYYDTEAEPEIVTEPETGDETAVYPLNAEEIIDFGNGWMIGSRGQVIIWEKDGYTLNYGDTSGRNPATVNDLDPNFAISKYFITLGEKNNDAPYNAYIATTGTYAGPFDVVAYVGNGSKPSADKEVQDHQMVVFEVSADKQEWTQIGDTCDVIGPRLFHKFTSSYEGTDEVYVRTRIAANNSKAQFYEIYIANEGVLSQELLAAGIEEIATADKGSKGSVAQVYSLGGQRMQGMKRGVNIVRYTNGTTRKQLRK